MMKRFFLGAALVVLVAVLTFWLREERAQDGVGPADQQAHALSPPASPALPTRNFPQRVPASVPRATAAAPVASSVAGAPPDVSSPLQGFYASYFNSKLLGFETVKEIYRSVKAQLPAATASELVAMYISEAPIRNSTPEFGRFMAELHESIRTHSNEIYDLLIEQDATFKRDPFVYQMVLNLAFQLDVAPDRKAKLYGNAMSIHFEKQGQNGVTLMSANITNALILMKNSGVSLEQALPYIQKGLVANQDNPDSMAEFIARARAYYPGSI